MNDIADRMQLIEINYYASGKFLGVTLSAVYPNYREGDTIELQLDPTPRERVRRYDLGTFAALTCADGVHATAGGPIQ